MRRQVETLLLIGVGGFIGANARYLLNGWVVERVGSGFPWGTLLINFTGSCLLAVLVGWLGVHTTVDPRVRLLVAVGFFGAYTTFSTYAVDSVTMAQAGNWIGTLGNILGSNLICLVGAAVGLVVGGRL